MSFKLHDELLTGTWRPLRVYYNIHTEFAYCSSVMPSKSGTEPGTLKAAEDKFTN